MVSFSRARYHRTLDEPVRSSGHAIRSPPGGALQFRAARRSTSARAARATAIPVSRPRDDLFDPRGVEVGVRAARWKLRRVGPRMDRLRDRLWLAPQTYAVERISAA
jgi:hypothetical protein